MKYLFGASGHAKVVAEIITSNSKSKIEGFFDDYKILEHFFNRPFLGKFENFNFSENAKIIVSIGDNKTRQQVVNRLQIGFFSAIDQTAKISASAKVETGTVIMPNATVNADTKIGAHCIINTSAVVEHDCVIQNFSHVSPNATLTGNVFIGEGTHIGAAAVVLPNIKIGKWCVIGAGAVVTKDIPDHTVVVGNPARIIKTN